MVLVIFRLGEISYRFLVGLSCIPQAAFLECFTISFIVLGFGVALVVGATAYSGLLKTSPEIVPCGEAMDQQRRDVPTNARAIHVLVYQALVLFQSP